MLNNKHLSSSHAWNLIKTNNWKELKRVNNNNPFVRSNRHLFIGDFKTYLQVKFYIRRIMQGEHRAIAGTNANLILMHKNIRQMSASP